MLKQEVLKIGQRLLGLYLFAIGLVGIPQIFMAWELAASTPSVRPWAMVSVSAAQSAIAIAVGLLLIYLSRGPIQTGPQTDTQLFDGRVFPALVQLLGVYLAFHAFGPLIKGVINAVTISASWQFHVANIGADFVSLIAGLFLVVRARRVVTWLSRAREKDA